MAQQSNQGGIGMTTQGDTWIALTDDDRKRAFESLPNMLDGFLKKWGWLHFAKAIEEICKEKNAAALSAATARLGEVENDLLRATSIGVATIISRCGAYGELSPYLKGKVDELQAMQMKCDAAFKRNQDAALRREA